MQTLVYTTASAFDVATVPTVSIGEAEACSVKLEGTSVREPLRHPAVTLGIPGKRESGRNL